MYQREEFGLGGGGPAAALTLAPPLPTFGRAGLQEALDEKLARIDLVVDLGARIGSGEWWRGLATCTALCTGALMLRPAMPVLDTPVPAPLAPAHYDEARAQAISPLSFGGDTGRRMAATEQVQPLADTPERPTIDLTATLGIGDGFARVLERAGVGAQQAREVADLVASRQPLGEIAPGTRIDLTLGRRADRTTARPLDRLHFRARFDLALGLERQGDRFLLRPEPIAVDETPLRVTGRVGTSLYRTARAAGAPARAVEAYLKAIASRMSIGAMGSDDRFDLILEHRRAATGETETGKLLYAGLDHRGKDVRLLRWTLGGREQWFEASGQGERRGMMTRPVQGRTTSSFGLRRHPILGFTRFHRGMDFAAAYGTPIVASVDGTVRFAGWHGGHGNYVRVAHGGGIETGYAHMSRIVARPGSHVAQGQLIGYVGSTGLSTGPHLHYEVYRGGAPVNPATFAFSSVQQIAGGELQRFKATLARLMAVRAGGAVQLAAKAAKPAG
ncbi:M23 family metallopeptidase [Sphingomonas jatrophae]|uniref:Murein DD-endopeptidase MepM and murein hydrolase activator NlpD, contain LysM domain n=1 Tax=Sphingomonas jatrophae TaxID=1166337 RepID=A0A1I6LJ41_9SPHN|nr:M23 family metallopeptidase [Sphingomonas jatrophae]SFS03485.1 Murein DD-endopeptidase MepM and murein hydrolase activator NlpD, contain LysM domain [Sphingomonas jatrophae]